MKDPQTMSIATLFIKEPTIISHASIGQRLRTEMRGRNITAAELAKRADVKTSFIYDIISGKSTNPSTVKLARVAYSLGVDLAYLAGHINPPNVSGDIRSPIRNESEYAAIASIGSFSAKESHTAITIEQQEPAYIFSKHWLQERFDVSPADMRLFMIHDDSMRPTLGPQDIILIDTTQKTPTPPGIFILFDGLGMVVKRLEYIAHDGRERLRIMSDNPQYDSYEQLLNDTTIIGRVVWVSRQM